MILLLSYNNIISNRKLLKSTIQIINSWWPIITLLRLPSRVQTISFYKVCCCRYKLYRICTLCCTCADILRCRLVVSFNQLQLIFLLQKWFLNIQIVSLLSRINLIIKLCVRKSVTTFTKRKLCPFSYPFSLLVQYRKKCRAINHLNILMTIKSHDPTHLRAPLGRSV